MWGLIRPVQARDIEREGSKTEECARDLLGESSVYQRPWTKYPIKAEVEEARNQGRREDLEEGGPAAFCKKLESYLS